MSKSLSIRRILIEGVPTVAPANWPATGGEEQQAGKQAADTNQLTIGQWPTNWPLSCRCGLIFTYKFPILVINPWVNSVSLKQWWMTKLTLHGSDTDVYVAHLLEKEASGRQELLRALSFTLMKRICNASLCRPQKPSSWTSFLPGQTRTLVDRLSGLM